MGLHNVLDDGEAEAGAAGFARARLVDAVEALEDALQVLGGNAGAEVLNGELDLRGEKARGRTNAFSRFCVFEAVFQEVSEDLMHGVGIGHDQSVGRAGGLNLDARVDEFSADRVDGVAKQDAGADGL